MSNTTDIHIISSDISVREALRRLNSLSGQTMTLFLTESPGQRLVGSLTDGDVRRALIGGLSLEASVSEAANHSPRFIRSNDGEMVDSLRELRRSGISLVPVVDDKGAIERIIDLKATPTRLPLSAILMAGGKGERLRPMTLTTPKPLLQIEGKAIIDYNIEALARCGIEDISVTVNYLAEQLEEHFADGVAGVRVKTVREDRPLGTIGSARLADIPAEGNTLVMNSDLLTSISFEELYLRHRDTGADITVAVIPYQISVPFAILGLEGEQVTSISEKPSYTHFANAGIYIISNRLLHALPDGRTDATDLIEKAIADGLKVVTSPVNGSWVDIGSPGDFATARQLMKHHKNFNHSL